jgi:hypothetical protein
MILASAGSWEDIKSSLAKSGPYPWTTFIFIIII